MELQPRSESSTCESSIDPGYNPKYSVRLSLTTSSVFPNYHSPDSLKPSPQEKPFPSPSRLFLFLAKPIDEKKSQQHQKKSHQKQQKTHKPRHASTRPTTFSSNNSLVDRRTSRLSSTSFWPRSSRPCALLGSACDHGLAKLSFLTPCATSSFFVLILTLFHNSCRSTTRVSSSPRSQRLNSHTEPPYFPSLAGKLCYYLLFVAKG